MNPGRTLWPLALSALLAVGYGAVLMQPAEVSPRYRLYLIEGAISKWNGGHDPIVKAGEELDFGQPLMQLSRLGWGAPENGGRWTVAGQAGLVLHLPANANVARLEFDVTPFVAPSAGLAVQKVRLRMNGRPVGDWTVSEAQILQVAVPHDLAFDRPGELRLSFELATAQSPKSLGIAPDRRVLGLHVRRLRLD